MKESLKILLLGIVIGAIVMVSLISLTHCINVRHERIESVDNDTVSVVVVHDIITDTMRVPVETRPRGTVTARLPAVKSDANKKAVIDSVLNAVVDSNENRDSVAVLVPIEQKVFTDSANYRAVISGYHVSLDTLAVFRQREYITQRLKPPARRWGLSVGIGPVVGTDGRVRPGVFVGATYTFLTF